MVLSRHGAVARGVAGVAADGAPHREASLSTAGGAEALGALEGLVALLTASGAVLLVLEGAVEEGKLAELGLLMDILLVVNDDEHIAHDRRGLVKLGLIIPCDEHVEGFVLPLKALPGSALGPLLDGSPPPDGNFAPRLGLELLLRLAAGPEDEAYEVVVWMLVDGDGDFGPALLPDVARGPHGGVQLHDLVKAVLPRVAVPLPPANCAGILPLAHGVVLGRRGRAAVAVPPGQRINAGGLDFEVGEPLVDPPETGLDLRELRPLLGRGGRLLR